MTKMVARDWSKDLPNDLVCAIVERFGRVKDYLWLGAICKSWRQALKENSVLFRQQLPWLMLPFCKLDDDGDHKGHDGNDQYCRAFFDPLENKVHHIQSPETYHKTCKGSCFGWLVMAEASPAVFLLNHLTRQQIQLPPITTFPDVLKFVPNKTDEEYLIVDLYGRMLRDSSKHMEHYYIKKAILSHEAARKDCVIMALCGKGRRLAFCRPGDKKWTLVRKDVILSQFHDFREDAERYIGFHDIVYWRNQFYAVDSWGSLVVCDLSVPKVTRFFRSEIVSSWKYLVVNPFGELMMVNRVITYPLDEDGYHDNIDDGNDEEEVGEQENVSDDDNDSGNFVGLDNDYDDMSFFYKSNCFEVFKLDEDAKEWRKVNNIGDYAFFLGVNSAICLSVKDYPGCKSNCIYFTDDYDEGYCEGKYGGHDMGIFNIDSATIEPFSCCSNDEILIWPPPVWVSPSLY